MRAYLDESYNDQKYFVGAAVATAPQWATLEASLNVLRSQVSRDYGLPADVEFHAVEMMGGRKEWAPLRGAHREVAGILAAILTFAKDSGVHYIIRGVDIEALNRRYASPKHPHSICLEHVAQRLEKHARYHSQPIQSLELIADNVDIREELQSQFAGYQLSGTSSWFNDNKLEHLRAPIRFEDSRLIAGLQVADIFAYLYRRREVITEKHPKSQKVMDRLMGLIDPLLINGSGTWTP